MRKTVKKETPMFTHLLRLFAATASGRFSHQKIPGSFLSSLRGKGFYGFAICIILVLTAATVSEEHKILFRENFNTLDDWKPYYFPKIHKHSEYTIEKNGSESYLRAESNASASAIINKNSFEVREYPRVRWRWKVRNIYRQADPKTKAGDDYPICIFVMFEYDPRTASFGEKIIHAFAKIRFGEHPPQSSLNYIWSSLEEKDHVITSPMTKKANMMVLRMGSKDVGKWQDEEVNLLEDYRKAFKTDPPARARLAIMNDSDNTGESSVSWVDYIEVYR